METAIEARRQGHQVILIEKEDHLGGQMVLASIPRIERKSSGLKNISFARSII